MSRWLYSYFVEGSYAELTTNRIDELEGIELSYNTTQDNGIIWGPNTYCSLFVTADGLFYKPRVQIREAEITNITLSSENPITFNENENGYRYSSEYGFYFVYNTDEAFQSITATVEYEDNREPLITTLYELIYQSSIPAHIVSQDSYENRWIAGEENYIKAYVDGFYVEYPVEIISGPIERVTVTYDGYFYENINGDYSYSVDDGVENRFFSYNIDDQRIYLTVEFNDGREPLSGTLYQFASGDFGGNVEEPAPPMTGSIEPMSYTPFEVFYEHGNSYYTRWTVGGENELYVYVNGKCSEPCYVDVYPNPIESISADYRLPVYENLSGSEYSDGEHTWFYYDAITSGYYVDMTFNNGLPDFSGYVFELDCYNINSPYYGLDYYFTTYQDNYESRWTVGGENPYTVYFGDVQATCSVTISENPVESFTAWYDRTYIENTGGFNTIDSQGNPSYNYNIDVEKLFFTINFNDERGSVTGTYAQFAWGEYSELLSGIHINYLQNQYFEPWSVGENNILTVNVGALTQELNIVITESPIDFITAYYDGTLTENRNGHWSNTYVGEEYIDYFHYYLDSQKIIITVNFKDGRDNITASYYDLASTDMYYDVLGDITFNYVADQSMSPWYVGSTNTFAVCVGDATYNCTVEIVKSPVESIYAWYDGSFIENSGGQYETNSDGIEYYNII